MHLNEAYAVKGVEYLDQGNCYSEIKNACSHHEHHDHKDDEENENDED